MTDLQNITFDEINVKLLLILYSNENKLMDQYTLFNLIVEKFRATLPINYVSPDFKSKFLLILRSLMSKNDNITVTKKNNVYYAGFDMQSLTDNYTINYSDYWLDKNSLNNYIIENNLEEELDYIDPESGNSFFHDILSSNDINFVEKIIKTFDINYNLKNNADKTPIQCINDVKIAICIINDLNNHLCSIDKRIKNLESKDYINEISINKFLQLKFNKFINENFNYLLSFVLLLICTILYKLI